MNPPVDSRYAVRSEFSPHLRWEACRLKMTGKARRWREGQRPPAKPQAWDNEWLKAIRPFRPTPAPDSQTGASHRPSLLRSPLTPALSRGARGERDKRSPRGEESSPLDGSQWVRLLFPLPPGEGQGEGEGRRLFRDLWNSTPLSLTGASRYCPRRTVNRPGSQRMARHKITDFLQSASAGRQAADGDRPRSGVSIEMRPSLTPTLSHRERENPLTLHERCGALGSLTARRW